ncbi:protein gar2-like, partial [Trifolium medium]|nr:protein gar2-like [Trifolium medium]
VGLPEEEFVALKESDLEAALKLLLSKKAVNPSNPSEPSNSTASDSEISSAVRQDSLMLRLYNDFINGDILAYVEEHPSNAFKHKDFLNKLHNPYTDLETLGKVIKLESILDQFATTVQNLKCNSQRLVGQQAAYD